MFKIGLQAGHWNVTSGSTGAPGEQELNLRIMMGVKDMLISRSFQVYLFDANPPDDQIDKDFDLFLALHGDADIYGTGGGCISPPDPNIDLAHQESKRISQAIESEYFHHSEIVNHPERVNPNMTKYYMWRRLSAKTPCVILEMGVVQDEHDKVLLADTNRIASAITRGICKAFDVPFDTPSTPDPEPEPDDDCEQKLAQANEQIRQLKKTNTVLEGNIDEQEAEIKRLNEKVNQMKKDLTEIKGIVMEYPNI